MSFFLRVSPTSRVVVLLFLPFQFLLVDDVASLRSSSFLDLWRFPVITLPPPFLFFFFMERALLPVGEFGRRLARFYAAFRDLTPLPAQEFGVSQIPLFPPLTYDISVALMSHFAARC